MRISDWSSDVCSSDLTLTVAGRYLEAERVARKIKRDFYRDGQFGGAQYPAATAGPIYRDSWLTWGAHLAGRYDMSVPAANAISRQLCPTTGGVLVDGDRKSTRRNSSH